MRRVPIMVGIALVYLMGASMVLANAYSTHVLKKTLSIAGYSGLTDICLLSGIETGPTNTGVTTSYFNHTTHCQAADQRALASGYLGTKLYGYIDSTFCGQTNWYYSNVATHYWQIWSNLCANPSGSQWFFTQTFGRVFDGSGYLDFSKQNSPAQNY
jgi:hypothetical protein